MATVSLYVAESDASRIPGKALRLLKEAGFETIVVKYPIRPGIPQLSPPSGEEKCLVDRCEMPRDGFLAKIEEGYTLFNLVNWRGDHVLIRVHGRWALIAWFYPRVQIERTGGHNAKFLALPLSHFEQSVNDTMDKAVAFEENNGAQWLTWPEAVTLLAWDGTCP